MAPPGLLPGQGVQTRHGGAHVASPEGGITQGDTRPEQEML